MTAFILFLSFFNEAFIEYFVSSESKTQPYLKYIAMATGVLLAVIFQVNILEVLPFEGIPEYGGVAEYALYVMTGIVISRGSNFVNSIFSLTYAQKKSVEADMMSRE